MKPRQTQAVAQGNVELRLTRSGEWKAYIVDTRISVQNIYVLHELQGRTPDEILADYPHLTLAQIYSALAYYYEHAADVRDQLKRVEQFADRLAAEQGSTRFSKLRDECCAAIRREQLREEGMRQQAWEKRSERLSQEMSASARSQGVPSVLQRAESMAKKLKSVTQVKSFEASNTPNADQSIVLTRYSAPTTAPKR
jgi:uncharacterized protein (DUF433 family)